MHAPGANDGETRLATVHKDCKVFLDEIDKEVGFCGFQNCNVYLLTSRLT